MHCVEGWGEATTKKITVNTAVENKHCGNKAGPVKPGLEFSSQGFCCHCNSVQLVVPHFFLVHSAAFACLMQDYSKQKYIFV